MRFSVFAVPIAAILGLTGSASAETLTTWNIPFGYRFIVECTDGGSQCIVDEDCFSKPIFRAASSVVKDEERFSPDAVYQFNDNSGSISTPFIAGEYACDPPESGPDCQIICEESCTCNMDPDEFIDEGDGTLTCTGSRNTPCTVVSEAENEDIPSLDEQITFVTPIDAEVVQLRCFGQYQQCRGDSEFNSFTILAPEEFQWGEDISGCQEEPCDIDCDPGCTCTVDGVDCALATDVVPTDAPTQMPDVAPTDPPAQMPTASASAPKIAVGFVLLATMAWLL